MKKILIILLLLPVFILAQTTEAFDFISPFSNDVAAIKKGDSWGFINDKGIIVIPLRDDLVLTKTNGYKYPIFKNNRCLISEEKEGIKYFGYIDKRGKTVIPAKFLNAYNFNNEEAIVLELIKEELGKNEILGKNIVYYRYYEVVIDCNGINRAFLNPKGVNVVLDKKFLRTIPKITSKRVYDNVYAVLNENKKWTIVTTNK